MAKGNKRRTAAVTSQREICFTIMPFGGWLDDYYATIYRPAIEATGLEAHRADDLFRPSTIVTDIWSYTKKAKLLLADLTGKNPNVFYELGLAHALAKPAILIAESMDEIPFDLRALRIIVYDKNAPDWGKLLRQKVEASIKEVLNAPVTAVLPAFLDVKTTTPKVAVTPHEREIIEIKQELDLLRRAVRTGGIADRSERAIEDIGPDEARALIASYKEQGMPDEVIVARLRRLGPPPDWIVKEIRLAKQKRRQLDLRLKSVAKGRTATR